MARTVAAVAAKKPDPAPKPKNARERRREARAGLQRGAAKHPFPQVEGAYPMQRCRSCQNPFTATRSFEVMKPRQDKKGKVVGYEVGIEVVETVAIFRRDEYCENCRGQRRYERNRARHGFKAERAS